MKLLHSILIAHLLPLAGLSQAPHYRIYRTSTRQVVTLDSVVRQLDQADILFFGESHGDSTGHILEFQLLEQIESKYPGRTALSLEMFETDCQTILNEYLRGLITESDFTTQGRAWPNYRDYRPLIELAKSRHIPVVAANAPARYVHMVSRLGLSSLSGLDRTARSWLPPLPVDTATGAYFEKFSQIMGGHSGGHGAQLFQAQNLWDATMAWSLSQFSILHHGFKILQVNGAFHSQDKLGVPAQMHRYRPGARTVNIATFTVTNIEHPEWSAYDTSNDYILLRDE